MCCSIDRTYGALTCRAGPLPPIPPPLDPLPHTNWGQKGNNQMAPTAPGDRIFIMQGGPPVVWFVVAYHLHGFQTPDPIFMVAQQKKHGANSSRVRVPPCSPNCPTVFAFCIITWIVEDVVAHNIRGYVGLVPRDAANARMWAKGMQVSGASFVCIPLCFCRTV